MRLVAKALLPVSILALAALPALAQPVISAKSGVVSYVIGRVLVNDQEIKPSETKVTEIKENGVLRTEEGRAEVLRTFDVAALKAAAAVHRVNEVVRNLATVKDSI